MVLGISVNKEQLDKFIDEEVQSVFSEQESDFTASERDRIDRSINRAQEEIGKTENKIKSLKAKSQEHKRAMSARTDRIERDIERLQSLKFERDAKETEEELKQDREKLDSLISDKREFEAEDKSKPIEAGIAESSEDAVSSPTIKRKFANQEEAVYPNVKRVIKKKPAPLPIPSVKNTLKPVQKKKSIVVQFNKTSKSPFIVKFSERGFVVGDTRLSFEVIENALSKGYTITLKNGFVLDSIKMQKVLKYKDKI